jgi:hypothetical protein
MGPGRQQSRYGTHALFHHADYERQASSVPGLFLENNMSEDRMKVYEPVTVEEIAAAYELLVGKRKGKKRIPVAYRGLLGWDDPARIPLLPVGIDKMTTVHVERTPETKLRFFREMERIFNETDRTTGQPKFKLKRFKVNVTREKKGDREKERRTVLLSLRDQVMMRVFLERLKRLVVLPERWNDMFRIVKDIRDDLLCRKGRPVVIRTDISEFHPSIDRRILLGRLTESIGDRLDAHTAHMLEYVIDGYPSKDEVTGLPLGMPTSVLLAEFYAGLLMLDGLMEGVGVHRYADDILIVADEGADPEEILKRLDARLAEFSLKRNTEKTKVLESPAFQFIGVNFDGPVLGFEAERRRKWAHGVWGEVSRDLAAHEVAARLSPDRPVPDRKEVIQATFREYTRGPRSSRWRWMQKVLQLNGGLEV